MRAAAWAPWHVHMHTHTCTHIYTHIPMHAPTYIYLSPHTPHTHMYTCTHTYAHTYASIREHRYKYTRAHTYTCTHAHTHTISHAITTVHVVQTGPIHTSHLRPKFSRWAVTSQMDLGSPGVSKSHPEEGCPALRVCKCEGEVQTCWVLGLRPVGHPATSTGTGGRRCVGTGFGPLHPSPRPTTEETGHTEA